MILAAPHIILPPEKPAIVRASDLKGLPTWQEMQRRQKEATFPFAPMIKQRTYTTWNPSDKDAGTSLSGGNLTMTYGTNTGGRAVQALSGGKYYWEITVSGTVAAGRGYGVSKASAAFPAASANNWQVYLPDGTLYVSNTSTIASYLAAAVAGNVYGIALDAVAGKVWVAKSNTWGTNGGVGDPAAGTNPGATGLTGPFYPSAYGNSGSGAGPDTVNFGASAFTYTPPTGFIGVYT